MKLNHIVFKTFTRTVAMAFAIPFLVLFPLVLAFGSNVEWSAGDYFFASLGGIYVLGIFIGLKWPGIGGFISIIFPTFQILQMIISFIKGPGDSTWMIILFLLLSIPSIVYFIYWIISRRLK